MNNKRKKKKEEGKKYGSLHWRSTSLKEGTSSEPAKGW
jgi:hypothetical protein